MRGFFVACVLALALALPSCARTTEGVGGETNWLKCDADDECGDGLSCRDGECVPESDADAPDAASTDRASTSPGSTGAAASAAGDVSGTSRDAGTTTGEPSGAGLPSVDPSLGLQACPEARAVEWLADFRTPVACESGMCPMQIDAVSTLPAGGALVLANDNSARVVPGVPSLALLDEEDALGAFQALPDAPESGNGLAGGSYVAMRDVASPSLYRWQAGELASLDTGAGVVAIAGDDASVAVVGQLATDGGPRHGWLALYEGTGPEQWRIDAPADATSDTDEISQAVARDPSDQSISWLVGRYADDTWRLAVARIDAEGNSVWTTRLDPEGGAQWNTDRDDWLVNPGVAAAGGVTSIAGAVNTARNGAFEPPLRLSFRQYDADGAELRRWDGLGTDSPPNATPIAADGDGNVYVAWAVRTMATPRRLAILRFGPSGDPCVLADVPDDFPTGLALRATDLLLSSTTQLGRVPR